MFAIGQAVVYPAHGAGRIVGLDERSVLGERRSYYVLELLGQAHTVMVPVEAAQTCLRPPLEGAALERLLDALKAEVKLPAVWMQRHREEEKILASGDPYQVAALVGTLFRYGRGKALSLSERGVSERALAMLASELALTWEVSLDEAKARVLARLEAYFHRARRGEDPEAVLASAP
ncbi:MAG: CarD family transcriptional regulator [Meiothermus sp.]